ncbi:MAG: VWA domain-containing protein [candidate division KSB1 bacterium]|jgi:hypothetical protein|nr:VWA domain-containing protein [candidate division KSB1 bacterium]
MFTFLNTSVLAGIAAIAIPLIILLITRQKVVKIDFSSILFLRELRTQKIRRIKIRQILLLILRTLIVLLLILAFARPTMKGGASSMMSASAKTSAVILIDNSMSMNREVNGVSLMDQLREKAAVFEEIFNNGDEIYALFTDEAVTPVYRGARYDVGAVVKNIKRVEAGLRRSAIVEAIIKARDILEKTNNINKEIYFISDLQQSGYRRIDDISAPLLDGTDIKLIVLPCSHERLNNLAVVSVESQNQIIEKGKVLEVETTIKNFGDFEEKSKLVQLYVEGKRTAQNTVTLAPDESRKVIFNIIPQSTGTLSGYVVTEEDALLADNRRYFTFHVPDKIKTLVIGNRSQDFHYLKIALNVSPNIDVATALFDEAESIRFDAYDVLILTNIPKFTSSISRKVQSYLEQNGALILFLGSDADLSSYNTGLCDRFGLPPYTDTVGELGLDGSYMVFGQIDRHHPVIKGLYKEAPEEIKSPKFYYVVNSESNLKTDVVISFSNGSPFLSEHHLDQGKILRFNTAIDAAWSDFHFQGLFVPLINRSITYIAAAHKSDMREMMVGDEISGRISADGANSDLIMIKPDGSESKLKTVVDDMMYKILFRETEESGIYTLYSGERSVDKWAVNFSASESEGETASDEMLAEAVGADHIRFYSQDQSMRKGIMIDRYGRELWKYLLAVVLIFMIIEMVIAREPAAEANTT